MRDRISRATGTFIFHGLFGTFDALFEIPTVTQAPEVKSMPIVLGRWSGSVASRCATFERVN